MGLDLGITFRAKICLRIGVAFCSPHCVVIVNLSTALDTKSIISSLDTTSVTVAWAVLLDTLVLMILFHWELVTGMSLFPRKMGRPLE